MVASLNRPFRFIIRDHRHYCLKHLPATIFEILEAIFYLMFKKSYSPPSDINPHQLYAAPVNEFGDLPETPPTIRNVGWTLGNDCPYRCTHCYSMSARTKGQDMTPQIVDRVINQLVSIDVKTVNLGGNEPLFTNGLNPETSLLPLIIKKLTEQGIKVGLTTSGITAMYLYQRHPDTFRLLNDIDISFDSPFPDEHNRNRGAKLFDKAVHTLEICQEAVIPHTVVMAGMNWNFSPRHIEALVQLAKRHDANVRINPIKPVEPQHMALILSPEQYYAGFAQLLERCTSIDLGEPPIAASVGNRASRRCPCGRTSFRIHSITPDGKIHVSPCVYLHDYKSTLDLLEHDLHEIIMSPQFRVFRQRNANPEHVSGCRNCRYLDKCGGGCVARSYLHTLHLHGKKTLRAKDPYCPLEYNAQNSFPQIEAVSSSQELVHVDYLCTWIGKPH